jgi:cell division protein FtsL
MKRKEKIILIVILIVFLIFAYFSFSIKIDRSSVFPSHDKTLIIKNVTIVS